MKTAIVTGSSRGIGLATAKLLAANDGVEVIGTSTSGNPTITSPNFKCLPLDLSSDSSISKFTDALGHVSIDYLINNAGILLEEWDDPELRPDQLRATFEVNVFGTIDLTERLISRMNRGGHIINLSSGWGSFSEKHFDQFVPHYKMSKTAINMYTRLLAARLVSRGITVSALDPGWVRSDMGGTNAPTPPEQAARDILNLLNTPVESGKFWYRRKVRNW